jgi:hypothetical protein
MTIAQNSRDREKNDFALQTKTQHKFFFFLKFRFNTNCVKSSVTPKVAHFYRSEYHHSLVFHWVFTIVLILLAPMTMAENSRDRQKNDFALQVKTQLKLFFFPKFRSKNKCAKSYVTLKGAYLYMSEYHHSLSNVLLG